MIQQENKQIKVPDETHPIAITKTSKRIRVRLGTQWIAETEDAVILTEGKYPAVYYLPMNAVDASVLRRSDHGTYCPYKGDCFYYHVEADGRLAENAIWYYPAPFEAVKDIADRIAFYIDRVDEIAVG